ncbi:hypothetical protein CAAN1_04S00958 [[Candida] anglica]|uniref:Domain of unknown function at the cortex 1 domain-containing protein n=1 Tax=[Candida] anglica TaxID=148631 RepID=A0ABP0EDQ6_9ASCO
MSIAKRLVIKASNSYDGEFQIVPVNGGSVDISSEIGTFRVIVHIKNFDGAKPHLHNSYYNLSDKTRLDGSEVVEGEGQPSDKLEPTSPNLRLEVLFTPNKAINGGDLIFGNDFLYPIKGYVPTSLLNTGLKFFTWFISKTVKGDVYNDKPYLYGLALNSFSYITGSRVKDEDAGEVLEANKEATNYHENLGAKIPKESLARKKYFNDVSHAKNFTFDEGTSYTLRFDTNFLKMSDSKYAVSIPTYGHKTFDIDVLGYANETLNNFNWVIKNKGFEGVGMGEIGLVLNFALADEPREK